MILTFLYSKLMERLNEKVAEVLHIDLWNNQIAMEPQEEGFERPAVFIELQPVNWQLQGQKQQVGDIMIGVHVVTDTQGNGTSDGDKAADRNRSFERLILLEKVWVALEGYQNHDANGSQFSKLTRINTQMDTNSAQTNRDVITFKCRLTDMAAVPEYNTVALKLKTNGEIVGSVDAN